MNENLAQITLQQILTNDSMFINLNYSEFSLISTGFITSKQIELTYNIRNENILKKGFQIYRYNILINKIRGISNQTDITFFHFRKNTLMISLFYLKKEFIGFFSFDGNDKKYKI